MEIFIKANFSMDNEKIKVMIFDFEFILLVAEYRHLNGDIYKGPY